MTKLTWTTFVVAAAASVGFAPLVSAPSANAAMMPLSSQWRACDHSKLKWVAAVGYARPVAHLTSNAGTLTATIDMATALPYTHYDFRVIQTPRATFDCASGASGVLTGGVQTDGVGAGTATITGAVAPGATGAWVIVERPSDSSQTPAEFYTSEYVAAI
jgi:hypothetical protein